MRTLFMSMVSPLVRNSILFALTVALGAVAVDLVVKHVAWDAFVSGERWIDGRVLLEPQPMRHVNAVPGLLDLTAVANQGAAMGLGQGKRPLFLAVGVVACIALSAFFMHSLKIDRAIGGRVALRSRLYRVTLAMLLAGVLGNLYDRIVFGYVRDMFHMLPGMRWSDMIGSLPDAEVFPWVFNVADAYLCIGVGLILVLGLIAPEPETKEES